MSHGLCIPQFFCYSVSDPRPANVPGCSVHDALVFLLNHSQHLESFVGWIPDTEEAPRHGSVYSHENLEGAAEKRSMNGGLLLCNLATPQIARVH